MNVNVAFLAVPIKRAAIATMMVINPNSLILDKFSQFHNLNRLPSPALGSALDLNIKKTGASYLVAYPFWWLLALPLTKRISNDKKAHA